MNQCTSCGGFCKKSGCERADYVPPKQEPVAYDKAELNRFAQNLYAKKMLKGKHGHYESMFHVIHQCIKRVTTPLRKPLTDDEIDEKWRKATEHPALTSEFVRSFARDIEATHGIKE